jgi:hypothetical protein
LCSYFSFKFLLLIFFLSLWFCYLPCLLAQPRLSYRLRLDWSCALGVAAGQTRHPSQRFEARKCRRLP